MTSSSKRRGWVRTVEWWKHLRDQKRTQEKVVRNDSKAQIAEQLNEYECYFAHPDPTDVNMDIEDKIIEQFYSGDYKQYLSDCHYDVEKLLLDRQHNSE